MGASTAAKTMIGFKRAKLEKHIPLDATAAAARSLRHAAAIDGIVHLVVHADDVPIAAAINTRGRPCFGWPSVVLDRISDSRFLSFNFSFGIRF